MNPLPKTRCGSVAFSAAGPCPSRHPPAGRPGTGGDAGAQDRGVGPRRRRSCTPSPWTTPAAPRRTSPSSSPTSTAPSRGRRRRRRASRGSSARRSRRTSHSGWSGRGRSAESVGAPAEGTLTSDAWSSPEQRISPARSSGTGPAPGRRRAGPCTRWRTRHDPLDVAAPAQHGGPALGHAQGRRADVELHVLRPAPDVPGAGEHDAGLHDRELEPAERRRPRDVARDELGDRNCSISGSPGRRTSSCTGS